MSAGFALQKGIAARLAAHAATSAYTVRDNTLTTATQYVRVGVGENAEQIPVKGANIYTEEVPIEVITTAEAGSKTVKDIMEDVTTALFSSALSITADGYAVLAPPTKTFETVLEEIDPTTGNEVRRGIARFRFHTQKL
jgi:hypothetical protein